MDWHTTAPVIEGWYVTVPAHEPNLILLRYLKNDYFYSNKKQANDNPNNYSGLARDYTHFSPVFVPETCPIKKEEATKESDTTLGYFLIDPFWVVTFFATKEKMLSYLTKCDPTVPLQLYIGNRFELTPPNKKWTIGECK